MKKCGYCHQAGLLVLRLLLAAVFIYHVVPKFGAPDGLVAFVGGAPLSLGLDFLSANVWFYVAMVSELFIVITALLGFWTRAGSVVLWIVMFFAMTAKKRGAAIELDVILAVIGIVLFIAGPGKYAISKTSIDECCKKGK